MLNNTRLEVEQNFIRERFPTFKIQDPYGENCGVVGTMTTNLGNKYVIWIELGDFPNSEPHMYIVSPESLRNHDGKLLSECAGREMHLMIPDSHGHPQICHYNGVFWHPKVPLAKVLMKGRLWLHAYEEHLRTGENIDTYLPHME